MPDTRNHRGPHPEDNELFAPASLPALSAATDDLCWLLSRGYALLSATKLVGDRYSLISRQRTAVGRSSCSNEAAQARAARLVEPAAMRNRELWIDGYNLLTTVEAAYAGGVILIARDGCFRDMASMHGSYRKVAETVPAVELIGRLTEQCGVSRCRWFLDSPVSNSGRLKTILRDVAGRSGWNWKIELVQNPDQVLSETVEIIATADSAILDRCQHWVNLARLAVEEVPDAWTIDLGGSTSAGCGVRSAE